MSRLLVAPLVFAGLVFCSFTVLAQSFPLEGLAGEVASGGQKDVITFSQVRDLAGPEERQAHETLKGQELVEKIKEVRTAAIDHLVDRTLILQAFRAQGRAIPESLVDERLEAIIRNEFGGDREAFRRKLLAQGYTLEKFREHEREEIILQQMRDDATQGATSADDAKRQEDGWLKKLRRKAYIKVF